jgi:hypothetical protein
MSQEDNGGSGPSDQNRLRFEDLDLQVTEAVVRIVKKAAELAEQKPELFFRTDPPSRDELALSDGSPEAAAASLLEQLGPVLSQSADGPQKILETLIDLLIEEKKYWKPPPELPPEYPPPPPPEQPPPSVPGDPPFYPEPPSTTQCRVASFIAPTRRTGCRFEADPEQPGRFTFTEGFAMEAEFVNGADGSQCRCCEYRQYVTGQFVLDDRAVTLLLPNPIDPVNGRPRLLKTFPAFEEDGIYPPRPPANIYYGHRDEAEGDNSDLYLPDRATGCSYRGTDQPGLYHIKRDASAYFNLTFMGVIIDVCNGNALRAARVWTVGCSTP